ncbi:hypothetical protein [Amycolatopsis sp. NBC_00438]|uniref:hypothetical protein n=1 Tax=Amycolatopsis sp. NBC_00438 TaxID=2903558 RepID=UPI002E1A71EF
MKASPQDRLPAEYGHPAEVAGIPLTELAHFLLLLLIAGADFAVFRQVLSIIMSKQPAEVVLAATIGVTVCSLMLAHVVGRLLRDKAAQYRPVPTRYVLGLSLGWLVLGVAAFFVRILVAEADTAAKSKTAAATAWAEQTSGALLFAAFYVASGLVAAVGAYFTHNPLRTHYRKASAGFRHANRKLTRSQPPYQRALGVLKLHKDSRVREEMNYLAAKAERHAFADDLKRYAAVAIAAHLQNPSATDGMTLPDRIPFPRPPAAGGSEPDDEIETR